MKNIYTDIQESLGFEMGIPEMKRLGLVTEYLDTMELKFNKIDLKTEKFLFENSNRKRILRENSWHNRILGASRSGHSEDFWVYHIDSISVEDIFTLILGSGIVFSRKTIKKFASKLTPDCIDYFWSKVKMEDGIWK